jgi:DNA-binding GntR family transcriptional regulator
MTAAEVKNFHDCDVAFHRKIWALADNDYLRDTLEAISFRLFVFSVVGRWPENSKAFGERLAAVQQHLAILDGLRSRNRQVARQVFIKQTVQYWNTQYELGLSEEELMWSAMIH